MPADQVVDPEVSRAKFDRELLQFRKMEEQYLARGCWLLRAQFPEVLVAFASKALRPPSVVFGALLDFTNYDLWPPSVRVVNPFSRVPYRWGELPTPMPRRLPTVQTVLGPDGSPRQVQDVQTLLQASSPTEVPFLCLPGVREYHEHPAHTGDSWLLHRGKGEGTLYFIVEQLCKYGLEPIHGMEMQLRPEFARFRIGPEIPA